MRQKIVSFIADDHERVPRCGLLREAFLSSLSISSRQEAKETDLNGVQLHLGKLQKEEQESHVEGIHRASSRGGGGRIHGEVKQAQ